MRGVNLARRPFVNRRPVIRLAGLLWLVGTALLILNVRLFSGHWTGTAVNRQRLIEVNREIREQRAELSVQDRALARVDIRRQNRRTERLNSLISYRSFPWSALFDDLEDVVPLDVRLTSVKPEVQLKEPKKPRPRRTNRRRASGASNQPAPEAESPPGRPSGATQSGAEYETEQASEPLRRNEVKLRLAAVAKSEEALMELIDTLYASPSFRDPFLPGEILNLDSGSSSASVSVIYLTRPALPEDGREAAEPPDEREEAAVAAADGSEA